MILNKYFKINFKIQKVNDHIDYIISNLDESLYWTHKHNCLINMSNSFKKRRLIKNTNILKDEINYLENISNKYFNNFNVVYKKGIDLYKIAKKTDFTHDDINQLFDSLNEKQRFLLFCNLMISKKYCHFVVNNKYILEKMKPEINKFAPLFRYLLGYAWVRFYSEECIKKSFMKTTDDFIFDIHTASLLPVFPFNYIKPKDNPYMPIMVHDYDLNPSKNVGGIYDYCLSDIKNNGMDTFIVNSGICNLEEFKLRLNIFCTGNPLNNLFHDINFKECNAVITGSVMSACLQKHHPLMTRFKDQDSPTEKINNYFNEYYAKSDVDIMFLRKNNIYEFIDNVNKFYNQVVVNICQQNNNVNIEQIKLLPHKTVCVFITEDFIMKNINIDVDDKLKYVKENLDDLTIMDSLFKQYYDKTSIEKYNKLIQEKSQTEIDNLKNIYPDIFDKNVSEIKYYVKKQIMNNKFLVLNLNIKNI